MSRNRLTGDACTPSVLPVSGTYNEGTTDDFLMMASGTTGAVTVMMNGVSTTGITPADGDELVICDPFGVCSQTKTCTINGNGTNMAFGATAVASITFTNPGFAVQLVFSSALGIWVLTTTTANPLTTAAFKCRGASTGNIASLSGIPGVTDGLTYVAGQVILLVAQTSAAQNGPWTVQSGAWTRPSWWASGSVQPAGAIFTVSEGTLFSLTRWMISTAGAITVDTSTPALLPDYVSQQVSLGGGAPTGAATITNVPIRSATQTTYIINRTTFTTGSLTIQYNPSAITPGALGTASVTISAQVAAGTQNNADGSTLNVGIKNW